LKEYLLRRIGPNGGINCFLLNGPRYRRAFQLGKKEEIWPGT
jgi:hypothetical protein